MAEMGEQPRFERFRFVWLRARLRARVGAGLASPLLLLAFVFASGCAAWPPVRAIEAARYYARGTEALERGDAPAAIGALERASALQPNASEIQNHLGLAYWSGARRGDALRALERAVELDCDNRAAQANLERLRAVDAERALDVERKASNGG